VFCLDGEIKTDQYKMDEIGKVCSINGRRGIYIYMILVGRPEGKRPLGRP
jgi:hypothetical protein